jgi:hypothetical protein
MLCGRETCVLTDEVPGTSVLALHPESKSTRLIRTYLKIVNSEPTQGA